MHLTRALILLSALLLASLSSYALAEDPGDVVMKMEGETLTLGQLDALASAEIKQLEAEHQQKISELRQQILDRHVDTLLLEAEAKRRKLADIDALVKNVVDAVPAPDDATVQAFYEANKAELPPDADFETVKEDIRGYLQDQDRRAAFQTLLSKLRGDAKVTVDLPIHRVEVAAVGPARGPADAPIKIVVFSDFECPYCSRALEGLEEVMTRYKGKVQLVFRDYPLPFHENAPRAHEAARCAHAQEKFWAMHDQLFANQRDLAEPSLDAHATAAGLDLDAFKACMASGTMAPAVQADLAAGQLAGVNGTPAFFINGIPLSGAQPFEAFQQVIDRELSRAPQP